MKTIFLLRHAKSSWNDSSIGDHDRPLNKRGNLNAPFMGERLKIRSVSPSRVYSSTALRASRTAEIICQKIGYNSDKISFLPELYHADTQELVRHIQQIPNQIKSAMLVGHNPGLSELAAYEWGIPLSNLPTCGILEVIFNKDTWKDITRNDVKRVNFDYPKNPSDLPAILLQS